MLMSNELPEKPNFINEIIEEERTVGAALAWVNQFVRTVSSRPPPNPADTQLQKPKALVPILNQDSMRMISNRPNPRSAECYPASVMEAKGLTPILNVSDIASTVAWFEKWGWKKLWDWGMPPTFGAVGSGKEACIFLCQGAQGGRGRGANTTTFQQDGDEEGDKGVWMSVWVDDVDEMHKHCVAAGLEVTFPPTDMPWNVREMHLRHPDGHVFRVGRGLEDKK
jgi:Glyoxalase/Bleomycin resistance protein/Dioxygenase superfamily